MFFSVKRLEGCGSGVRTVRLHVQTRAACHMLMWQRVSGQGPHKLYLDAQTLAASSTFLFSFDFSLFLSSNACFLVGYCIILAYFVHLCIFLFSLGTFSTLVILFSVLLTVRILDLFEIINCIFVISAVLGRYVSVLFWTVL